MATDATRQGHRAARAGNEAHPQFRSVNKRIGRSGHLRAGRSDLDTGTDACAVKPRFDTVSTAMQQRSAVARIANDVGCGEIARAAELGKIASSGKTTTRAAQGKGGSGRVFDQPGHWYAHPRPRGVHTGRDEHVALTRINCGQGATTIDRDHDGFARTQRRQRLCAKQEQGYAARRRKQTINQTVLRHSGPSAAAACQASSA